jgi:Kef-type K+ transport system membrane component KefB
MDAVQLAAILAAAALAASMLSVEIGIAVALFELGLGVVLGNAFHVESQQWLDFIASFASIVLTFLAGLEVDPGYLRQRFAASASIGLVSFIGPFVIGLPARHSRRPR